MQIAQELAGYTLGQADLLRRAMGKKIRAEMEKQRGIFVAGATERGVSKPQANTIFDLLAKFADYGFNKSHAAAYAIVSYQTAYMKAHHPVEFLAASMTYDMANADKLNDFRRDAMRLGIEVLPPSVQTSYRVFEVADRMIFYALAAIKGVGEAAVDHIVEKRGDQPFASLEDFANRIDTRIVNRRTLEGLISAGALDCFGHDRAALVAGLDRIMGLSQRAVDAAESGQGDIFGALTAVEPEKLHLPVTDPWETSDKLLREFQALGFYFSAHPLDEYRQLLDRMRVQQYADFALAVKRGASAGRLAGTVASRQIRRTRTGNKMGIFVLSDATGQYEVIMFSETLAHYDDLMEVGKSVVLTVGADNREEGISLRANTVQLLEDAASKQNHALRVFLRDQKPAKSIAAQLKRKGESPVSLILIKEEGQGEVEIALPDTYLVSPPIANAVKAIPGVVDVELV